MRLDEIIDKQHCYVVPAEMRSAFGEIAFQELQKPKVCSYLYSPQTGEVKFQYLSGTKRTRCSAEEILGQFIEKYNLQQVSQ